LTVIGRFLLAGPAEARESFAAHCDTTADIAERLDLPGDVRRALPHALSRWDGKGFPPTLRGDQIAPVMRIVHIADDLEVYHRVGGTAAAVAMLRQRRATEFDPALVDLACACVEDLVLGLDGLDTWETVINGLQPLDRALDEPEFDRALEVMADYADLKSPWFLGHSRAVARLVSAAASTDPAYDELLARRAALVSRLGVTGVSTGTWNRPGPLSFTERERVRTVPYLTERILARAPGLAPLAAVAAMTHERMDGSGYPRGASGSAIVPTARLLAVAETYQALVEERPQRAAWSPARAADLLRAEADEGRLDPGAVRAVLLAAGHRVSRHRPTVASLTPREVEVLVRLVRGRSNRQIAEELHVTPRTVGTHVEHIYRKIQVSTRGAAAMFAMRHGLVDATTATDTD
jgi:HD-GYP domain-containing protein (c-di-GMP phosphodiesterase class II)